MAAKDTTDNIMVGIGQIASAKHGSLTCLAVGSCVALGLINTKNGFAAMAHIFLPKAPSHEIPAADAGKYADSAVEEMTRRLCARPSVPDPLCAYIAGGARMFSRGFQTPGLDIGMYNSSAVLEQLEKRGIPTLFADIGGVSARNVRLDITAHNMIVFSGSMRP